MRRFPDLRALQIDSFAAAFLAVFVIAATVFQLRDHIPPWVDRSSIDLMNGSLIWMVSGIALIMAYRRRDNPLKLTIWLGGCAALGLAALDEVFALHEQASGASTDDDWSKILETLVVAVALWVLVMMEQLRGRTRGWLVAGFAVHIVYLLSDLGDGDVFTITAVSRETLAWIEEYLELTTMCFYFIAFVRILANECALASCDGIKGDVSAPL